MYGLRVEAVAQRTNLQQDGFSILPGVFAQQQIEDMFACVVEKMDVPGYGPWTMKAGMCHVQPPVSILENMLSIRIHLDDCDESNGALRVIPGTHRLGRLTRERILEQQHSAGHISCTVAAGGVVLMRPLLLHASSPASHANHRRVIHIDSHRLYWMVGYGGR